jgi:hypothetical protein
MSIRSLKFGPTPAGDILTATGSNRAAVDTLLHCMAAAGEIERMPQGRYACKTGKAVGRGRNGLTSKDNVANSGIWPRAAGTGKVAVGHPNPGAGNFPPRRRNRDTLPPHFRPYAGEP